MALVFPNVLSSDDALRRGYGNLLSWTVLPAQSGGNQTAATSQKIHVSALGLRAGMTATNIHIRVGVAAAGTAPTAFYLALLDSAGNRVAVTADLKSDSKLTAIGWPSFAFATPYSVTSTGLFYCALLQNGSFGTTQPQFGRGSLFVADTTGLGSNNLYPAGNAGTGQSSIGAGPLSIAVAANDPAFFFAIS